VCFEINSPLLFCPLWVEFQKKITEKGLGKLQELWNCRGEILEVSARGDQATTLQQPLLNYNYIHCKFTSALVPVLMKRQLTNIIPLMMLNILQLSKTDMLLNMNHPYQILYWQWYSAKRILLWGHKCVSTSGWQSSWTKRIDHSQWSTWGGCLTWINNYCFINCVIRLGMEL